MSIEATAHPSDLKHTPLYRMHVERGARMVPFAGYEMPVQYPLGILKEHQHTRASAGLFDVSHMGQIALRPKSGKLADAASALETLVPADVAGLSNGRQRYALFTNENGGILDDLMVANRDDHLQLVVNAACKVADEQHLRRHVSGSCEVEVLDRALLALQGPQAAGVLAAHAPECAQMRFMDVRTVVIEGVNCIAARSGYTGEDGFEISIPAEAACHIAEALLKNDSVQFIGLGARDSLRLEAGLPLYGSDLDASTTPVEAALAWSIAKSRRAGGTRADGFPGSDAIAAQLGEGPRRLRVGLRPEGRQPVRAGATIYASESAAEAIGIITSGGFGPSVEAPVAMGYVQTALAAIGSRLFADVRGKRIALTVVPLPFFAHRYHRG